MSMSRSIRTFIVDCVVWGLAALAVLSCEDGVGLPGFPASIQLFSSGGSVPAGESFTVSGTVRDGRGDLIANPPVNWKSSAPTIATVVGAGFDSTGLLAAIVTGVSPGNATITATSGAASATVSVTVGQARLSIALAPSSSGDGQTGTVGSTLPNPLRVVVRRRSTAAAAITVHWTIVSDSATSHGSLSASSTATDAEGYAQVSWTLGHVAGSQSVTAWISDSQAIDSLVRFTALANPGPATGLRFTVDPTNIFPGRAIRPAVRVVAVDAFNNPTSVGGSVTVAIGGPGGASLSGTTSEALTCNSNGCGASFSDLSVDHVGTGYVLNASMSGLSSVSSAPFEVVAPGPARIAFQSNRGGGFDIYSMNSDGSGIVRLTYTGLSAVEPNWSPGGAKVAYVSTNLGVPRIYAMSFDGSGVAVVTDSSFYPAWSHDGLRIAASRGTRVCGPVRGRVPRCFVGNLHIAVMGSDGSARTVFTSGTAPAWSPDGRVAFANGGEVYVMNADGSGLTNLTNDSAYDDLPAWSPDGKKIAFVSNRGGASDLYVMSADGSGVTQLTHDQANEGRPAWSADGSRIAFASDKSGNWDIYVMNADGLGVVALTVNSAFDAWPAWAP